MFFKTIFNEYKYSSVKILISYMDLLNMLTCNPVKPGKYLKINLKDICNCHPCEYFPLVFFNCYYKLLKKMLNSLWKATFEMPEEEMLYN